MGVVVNNNDAKRNVQAILELREENNPREQSSHSHRNPDRGSRNEVPRGWESVGDDGADPFYNGHFIGILGRHGKIDKFIHPDEEAVSAQSTTHPRRI